MSKSLVCNKQQPFVMAMNRQITLKRGYVDEAQLRTPYTAIFFWVFM